MIAMAMQIHQQFATRNDCYTRNQAELAKAPANRDSRYAQYYRGPRGIMVHSTGANNPNLRRYVQPDDGVLGVNSNQNDWNRPGLEVCVHAFLGLTQAGDVAAYQILPWEYRAWHCGGDANNTHLSFEICEDNLRDRAYWEKTYRLARELSAELCRKFGLDPLAPGVLVDHAEGAALGIASNHADVDHWWSRYGVTMDDFRADVAETIKNYNANQNQNPEDEDMTEKQTREIAKEEANAVVNKLMNGTGSGDKHNPYADDAVQWAKDNGLVQGVGDGDYAWSRPLTRQEMVTILHRYQQLFCK